MRGDTLSRGEAAVYGCPASRPRYRHAAPRGAPPRANGEADAFPRSGGSACFLDPQTAWTEDVPGLGYRYPIPSPAGMSGAPTVVSRRELAIDTDRRANACTCQLRGRHGAILDCRPERSTMPSVAMAGRCLLI
jgi:hypothetical protein